MIVHSWQIQLPFRYRNLTPEQREKLCNGCGPKGGWIPVPEFRFSASCDQHDMNYIIGGEEADRLKADFEFYSAMKNDIMRLPWYRKPGAHIIAWTYYRAVRLCGKTCFHYGAKRSWGYLETL